MARCIGDIARLLQVQAGENPAMPFPAPVEPWADRLGSSMNGRRIAWAGDWGGAYAMEPRILSLCEQALRVFEDLGAIIEPVAPPFPAADLWQAWVTLRGFLNAHGKRDLLEDPARRALTKPETLWEIQQGLAVTAEALHAASALRSRWYATAADLFTRDDALALPSAQVWPFPAEWRWPEVIAGRPMDTYHRWMEVVIPASLAGLPALALPAGFGVNGLPMGLQLIGRSGADAQILAMGQQYDAATDWPARRPPPVSPPRP